MPPASSAAAARRRPRSQVPPRPRGLTLRPGARVRWDRMGRVALLVVFAAVLALYVKQGLSLFSTHSQAQRQIAVVQRLVRENRALASEQRALNDPATIARDARALGMVKPGERPYVITGLPSR